MPRIVSLTESVLFGIILAIWLMPIWSVDFFVTGDGPCHLYNSKILLDWYSHVNKSFYEPFYFVNTNFEPNWLFNLLTMPLLAFFSPGTAEKIFLSIYVLGFAFGFRFFLSQINPKSLFLSSVALVFCQHKLLMLGFYNNCLSFALWFWVAGWWWKIRDNFSPWAHVVMAFLFLLTYSAHPMGFSFAGLTILCLLFGLLVMDTRQDGIKTAVGKLFKRGFATFLSALPSFVLLIEFAFRRDWSADKSTPNLVDALENIGRLSSLVGLNDSEAKLAIWTAVFCWSIFIAALYFRFKTGPRALQASDGLFLFVWVAIYCIVRPPSAIAGGLEVPMRMVMVPYFAMLFWAATASFPTWASIAGQLGALALTGLFIQDRLPSIREASALAKEVYDCHQHIKEPAVILALNYDYTGRTPEGKEIANKIWLFGHVDCYIGAKQSAVISDNYEASYAYFPMIWRWQTGLPGQTDKDGINFYNRPPRADLLSYNRRTGQNLDYALLVNYRSEFSEHEYTKEIFSQLDQAYEKVYESPHRRAILYRRK